MKKSTKRRGRPKKVVAAVTALETARQEIRDQIDRLEAEAETIRERIDDLNAAVEALDNIEHMI